MMRKILLPPAWCLAPCAAGFLATTAWCEWPWLNHPGNTSPIYATARSSVTDPLARQAANGTILDQTVWNHHFEEGKSELHSSGYYYLDRIARRSSGEVLLLHLQTSRDLTYHPRYRTKFMEFRQKLDADRARAVADYLQAAYPHVAFSVHLVDPSPVGISGIEAAKAAREMRDTSRGVLPAELQQGIGSYLASALGGGGGGGGLGLSPVSIGTGAGPGSFGGDAPVDGGLGGGLGSGLGSDPFGGPAMPPGP